MTSKRNDEPTYPDPEWRWDGAAQAGYLDFYPEYDGKRHTRALSVSGGWASILIDYDEDGVMVGLEVLV